MTVTIDLNNPDYLDGYNFGYSLQYTNSYTYDHLQTPAWRKGYGDGLRDGLFLKQLEETADSLNKLVELLQCKGV